MSSKSFNIPASRYIEALHRNRIDHFVTVPDWVQLALHARIEAGIPGIRLVRCCNEDQAVAVSAGLHIGGKRPITVVQNQGLYACVNSIRAIGLDAKLPVVFLVGQFGREFSNFGNDPSGSRRTMVALLEPLLTVLGIQSWRLEQDDDLKHIETAFSVAEATKKPTALLVGAPIAWE